ncbi:MAG: ABC transporter ATP-binding protein [Ruminiclostridium sp.]|nr:ABC transporter ATP-binding protein [Ruminiclostridium sp.]
MLNKIRYRIRVLHRLLPYSKGVKRFFMLNIIISIISMMIGFVNPQFYKLFIDSVIIEGDYSKMIVVVVGYLGLFFIGIGLGYLKNYSSYTMVNTVTYRVKYKIWRGLFGLPFPDYEKASIGDMKMRLDDDTGQISVFAGYQSIDYLIAYVTLIISAVWLFLIEWRLAAFSIIAIPLTFWLDHIMSIRESVLRNSNRENDQRLSSWLHTSVQSWREVKALTLEHSQKRQFVRFTHNYAMFFAKWINIWTARVLVIPKIKDEFFMRFGLYFIGGLLIMSERLKISDLLVFAMYYEMLSGAVKTVSSTDAELQSNMPFTDRLMEELNRKVDGDVGDRIVPDDSNIIELHNVCFTYPNTDSEVLHNYSVRIEKGERIAIVGKSGCGKTTLLKLVTGMVKPTEGNVTFSGVDLNDIEISAMHKRIGFVMQENMLFNTTIRENLLYGKNNAEEVEMREACQKAYILEFIDSLPNGLDTVIGEKGIKLSGGQRQRIVLARLFLRDVDVFIFDEATSALDQYSENIVHDAIRNIAKDKTIIVVAHRESSIRLCNRKIVL